MKALLIDDNAESRLQISDAMIARGLTAFHPAESLQEGLEVLETQGDEINLTICNYRGGSKEQLEHFLKLSANCPAILIQEKKGALLDPAALPKQQALVPLERGNWDGLAVLLSQFRQLGTIDCHRIPELDLVKVPAGFLQGKVPAKLYVRLARDHYFDASEVKEGEVTHLYLDKAEFEALLAEQAKQPEPLLEEPRASREKLLRAASEKLEIIQNVVNRIGFTPQVQELAKRTVSLVLKAVGNDPKLGEILKGLKRHQGQYITSHSVMLAEVACAIAYRVGWTSSSTFLKLTMAALLHDLALFDNNLARVRKLTEASADNGFLAEDLHAIKMHPAYAADLSRKMTELPPDVDTVLMQHHERPAGEGFPRGLFHHQIAPLSALFIVAQDLLDFFLENEPANPSNDHLAAFLFRMDSEYREGSFKKLAHSLTTGQPLPT